MELRIAHARATKDIDLTSILRAKNESELLSAVILNDLRLLSRKDLNDHFIYEIGEPKICTYKNHIYCLLIFLSPFLRITPCLAK